MLYLSFAIISLLDALKPYLVLLNSYFLHLSIGKGHSAKSDNDLADDNAVVIVFQPIFGG